MLKKLRSHTSILLLALCSCLSGGAPLQSHAQSEPDTSINGLVIPDDEPDETADEKEPETYTQRFNYRQATDSIRLQPRKLPPGYAGELKKDGDFWYAGKDFRKKEARKKEAALPRQDYVPFMQRTWVQTLLWIIIIGGFAYAIMWYLMDRNAGLFRRRDQAVDAAEELPGDLPEDIFAISYQREIEKALAAGQYRMAVRLQYLRTLKSLSEKELIAYKQDKTNLDYLMELSSRPYYPAFFRLTRHFEYSWYGQFAVNGEIYRQIETEFRTFEKQI